MTGEDASAPIELAATGAVRDAGGRFLPGHPGLPGGGRPRRRDAFSIASERAELSGLDLEGEVFEVIQALIAEAKTGDPAAARLALSYLCGEPDAKGGVSINVVTGMPEAEVGSLEWLVSASMKPATAPEALP